MAKPSNRSPERKLQRWARDTGAWRVAVEGSGYGRLAVLELARAGVEVVEVPAQMTAVARRGQRQRLQDRSRRRVGDRRHRRTRHRPAPAAPRRSDTATAQPGQMPPRAGHGLHRSDQPAPRRPQATLLRSPPPHRRLTIGAALGHATRLRRGDHSARAHIARSRVRPIRGLKSNLRPPHLDTPPNRPPTHQTRLLLNVGVHLVAGLLSGVLHARRAGRPGCSTPSPPSCASRSNGFLFAVPTGRAGHCLAGV